MKPEIQTQNTSGLTIRRLHAHDAAAVERLAQLDSGTVPTGELIGAEVEDKLLAVVSLTSGESVADPFSRSGELRALLELRAAQLRGRENGMRSFVTLRGRRSKAKLAGSPPVAGGKLLSLQMRSF